MPQYLVCNYLPDDFDPSTVTEAMIEEIHALNRELIAAGYQPGPAFKQILQAVEDAQLEGAITTPDQAMSLVRDKFGPA